MPELVRLGRLGRVLVVELEERALPVPDLEEAHDLAEVVALAMVDLAPLDRGDDPLGDDGCLEVGRRAGLGQRQVCRIAERKDVRATTDLERRPVGR